MAFDCIIPAAGASSRMGSFKPLLPFGPAEATVVETTVTSALAAGLRVILVLGHRGGEIAQRLGSCLGPGVLGQAGLVLVDNPRWEEGMMSSLQAGLAQVTGDHFSTLPADMPLVDASIHLALEAAWKSERAAGLPAVPLFASCQGEAGHPVLIPSTLIPGLLSLPAKAKARPFLLSQGGRLVDIPLPAGAATLQDLDTYADYRAARRAHGLD